MSTPAPGPGAASKGAAPAPSAPITSPGQPSATPPGQGAKPPVKAVPIPDPPRIKGRPVERGSLLDVAHLREKGFTRDGDGEGQITRDRKKADAQALPPVAVIDKGEQAPGTDTQADAPVTGEFLFAGQKFKTQADAESYFNRARSNASAVEKREAKLKAEHAELVGITTQYEGIFNELQRRGVLGNQTPQGQGQAQAPQGQQAQPGQQQGGDPSQGGDPFSVNFVDSIPDSAWSQAESLAKTHGIAVGLAHVVDHLEGHIKNLVRQSLSQFQGQLMPQIQPVVEQFTQHANQQKAHHFWAQEVSAATDESTGAPLFPELVNNPQGAREVSLFWLHLGNKFGRDVAFSPEGFRWAHRLWSDWKAKGQAATADAGKAAASVVARMNQDQGAANSTAVSGGGVPPGQDAPPASLEQEIKRNFKTGGGMQRTSSTGIKLGII